MELIPEYKTVSNHKHESSNHKSDNIIAITTSSNIRPFVVWAAKQLEKTLKRKDDMGYEPWETQTHGKRYQKLVEEYEEVLMAFSQCCLEERRTKEVIESLQLECVDLALSALMLAGGFNPDISALRRGR